MTDLITPMILSIFGGVMAIISFGFYLFMKSSSKPRFETQDYYETYRGRGSYPRGRNPFKKTQTPAERIEQRNLTIIVVGLVILAIAVSVALDIFEGLLIIIMLPVIVRFVRARNEENKRRAENDENRRPY
ncbi:MAG: hypothetical protein JRN15_00550 [Nitrososphaerota archaeon]|nr:hypothetical protein [Nitrososphaerota archaeon]